MSDVAVPPQNRALPNELYRCVVEEIEHVPTLHSLLLVARAVSAEAERRLYRRFDLESRRAQLLFFERIATSPRAALLVRHITVHTPSTKPASKAAYWSLLPRALCAAVHLTSLAIPRLVSERLLTALRACTFCLTELVVGYVPHSASNMGLAATLERQPALRRLEVTHGILQPPQPLALPQLAVLCGDYSTLSAILPGLAVPYVRYAHALSIPVPERLVPALRVVRGCVISMHRNEIDKRMPPVVACLTGVQYLEMVDYPLSALQGTGSLPALEGIVVSGSRHHPTARAHAEAALFSLFAEAPLLRFIELEREAGNYMRWDRDMLAPRIVAKKHEVILPAEF